MQQPDSTQMQHIMTAMMPMIGLFILVGWAILIIPFWQIFKKAGMSGAMSLLMLIPLVNLVMLYVLAFSQWKVVPAPDYGAGYPPPNYPPSPPNTYPAGYVPAAAPYQQAAPTPAYVPPPEPPAAI